MSKKLKTEEETPESSRPSRSQRTLDWETPQEELERSKLQKLDSRRRERSGHDDGQDKVATKEGKKKEKTIPLITSFTAINESNDENENKTEDSTGTISPHKVPKRKLNETQRNLRLCACCYYYFSFLGHDPTYKHQLYQVPT